MSDFVPPMTMPRKNGEMASYGDDSKLLVVFSSEPEYQEVASKGGITGDRLVTGPHGEIMSVPGQVVEGAGYAIYKDVDYISIVTPGSKTDVKRKVKLVSDMSGPSDPERFPRQWAAYKNQTHQVSDGLPLEHWPPMPRSIVFAFKASQIYTVEQLEAIPDSALGNVHVMDARKWREDAKRYLASAKSSAPVIALQEENKALRTDLENMRAQMEAFMAAQNQPKRGPGRPPKETHDNDSSS